MKKGSIDSVLFSKPGYLKGTFLAAGLNQMRASERDGWQKAGHDRNFKLARATGEDLSRSPYKYMELKEYQAGSKNYKDEDGHVKTGPRNIFVSPLKQGQIGNGVYLGGTIPWVAGDKYGIEAEIAKKEREYHLSKLQDKPFCQRAKHTEVFNTSKQVMAEEPRIPEKKTKELDLHPAEHDRAFRPSHPGKKGVTGTLDRFPVHVASPA